MAGVQRPEVLAAREFLQLQNRDTTTTSGQALAMNLNFNTLFGVGAFNLLLSESFSLSESQSRPGRTVSHDSEHST